MVINNIKRENAHMIISYNNAKKRMREKNERRKRVTTQMKSVFTDERQWKQKKLNFIPNNEN